MSHLAPCLLNEGLRIYRVHRFIFQCFKRKPMQQFKTIKYKIFEKRLKDTTCSMTFLSKFVLRSELIILESCRSLRIFFFSDLMMLHLSYRAKDPNGAPL